MCHPPGKGIEFPVARLERERVAADRILALAYQTGAPETDAQSQQHDDELQANGDGDRRVLQLPDSRGRSLGFAVVYPHQIVDIDSYGGQATLDSRQGRARFNIAVFTRQRQGSGQRFPNGGKILLEPLPGCRLAGAADQRLISGNGGGEVGFDLRNLRLGLRHGGGV